MKVGNKKVLVHLLAIITLILSYFFPWFYAYEDNTEIAMNGLGQGYFKTVYQNYYIVARFSWDLGLLNIVGLVIAVFLAIIYFVNILNKKRSFLEDNYNLGMLSLIVIFILGVFYELLFVFRMGNITSYVLCLEITRPLYDVSDESGIKKMSVGYGFIIFLVLVVFLIMDSFLDALIKRKRYVIA